jgi:phage tail sheath protein FI
MPVQPTYPGVYIEELPSGVRTITGVATSITAFLGRALSGPINEPVTINSYGDFERIFGGLWADSSLGYVVRDFYLNGGSQAIIVRLYRAAAGSPAPVTTAELTVDTLQLQAASQGSWGNQLQALVDHDVAGNATNLFNLSVRLGSTGTVEVLRNVAVDAGHPRRVDKVLAAGSKLVVAVVPLPASRPAATASWATVAVSQQATDGDPLTDGDVNASQDKKQGLYALEKADLFNLLCIPPYGIGDVTSAVINAAAVYCEQRRAMLLVDPPSLWTTKDAAKTGIAAGVGTTSKNAALFFPRLREADPLRDNQLGDFVPCGAVAGVLARTDAQRGIWKAPAGLDATLVGVQALTVPLTDAENGELNPLGVNCLRIRPAAGPVVWGSRTLQGDDRLASEWKYIPVRRLALFLEESLYRGTQWVVFEPNDEPLWAQIRLNLGAFMHTLFRQGAFQGTSPRDAYLVKCDKETTTQDDRNRGVVNILVGFAPLKPAEFVIIQIQQLAGQVQT